MNWQSLLAAAALASIAVLAGGGAVRLVDAIRDPAGGATLLLIAGLVLGVVLLTLGGLSRSSTPYW